jgi:hypothetical protein
MSWANPTALWLLVALLLLLFVRRRQPQRRLAVANLYLWSAATARDAPSITRRLRRSLLLLLQAAFMAAVVTAIARPSLSLGASHVALVVDVSMSMGARHQSATRLDAAKVRAVQLAGELPRGSRVHLWTAAATPESRGEFGARDTTLEAAIRALQTTDTATDLESAVTVARQSAPAPSRIYLFTDAPAPTPTEDVEWTRFAEPAENVALTRLAARRRSSDRSIELLLAATNYGTQPVVLDAVISQNDSTLARQSLQLLPGSEGSAVVALPQTTGVVYARLGTTDALAADDSRAVALPPADPLRVLLINGSHFVEQALRTHPGAVVLPWKPNEAVDDTAYDVIVCDGCDDIPDNAGSAGVLVLPSRATAAREPAPVITNVRARAFTIVEQLGLESLLVAPVDTALPRTGRALPSAVSDDASDDAGVIAHAAGVPLIVTHEEGVSRVVELRLDPAAGFALEPAFPMLIANCLDWLAAPRRTAVTLTAGDLLQLRPMAEQSPPTNIGPVVTGPDGRTVPASDRAGAYIAPTERAGVYRIAHGTHTNALIVNPHVEGESNLLAEASPDPATIVPRPAMRAGWDAAGILLVLALALLAVEWRLNSEAQGAPQ